MHLTVKNKDPDELGNLYSLDVEVSYARNPAVFLISVSALKLKTPASRVYSLSAYRKKRPRYEDLVKDFRHLFPKLYTLQAYDGVNLDQLGDGYVAKVVFEAGVKDEWGRVAGDVISYKHQILLPDGGDLLEDIPSKFADEYGNMLAGRLGLRSELVPDRLAKGKQRNFIRARYLANWPEATDEELSVAEGELYAVLERRTPAYLRGLFHELDLLGFHVPLNDRPKVDNQLLV
jgi:hypothetical protein